jgi:hypothetical protein
VLRRSDACLNRYGGQSRGDNLYNSCQPQKNVFTEEDSTFFVHACFHYLIPEMELDPGPLDPKSMRFSEKNRHSHHPAAIYKYRKRD